LVAEDQLLGTSTAERRHSEHTLLWFPIENAASCRPQDMQFAIHPLQLPEYALRVASTQDS
jgi:hypothetical protein